MTVMSLDIGKRYVLWGYNFLSMTVVCLVFIELVSCEKSYEPSDQVQAGHNIPHLDWSLRRKSNKFNLSSSSEANSYGMSLIVLPTIIFILVALAVILLQLALILRSMARCCCACSKSAVNAIYYCYNKTQKFKEKYIDPKKQNRRAKVLFVLIVIATIVSISVVFDGDRRMNVGVHDIQDGLNYVSDVAINIEGHLDNMVDEAEFIQTYLETNSCPSEVDDYMDSIAEYIGYFNGAVDDSKVVTRSVPRGVDIANAHMERYAVKEKGIVIFFFFFAVVTLALLFAIAAACKNAFLLKILILFTELLVIALVGICCVEMVMVMAISDFCIDPAQSVITLTPRGAISSVVKYYTLCTGTDPLEKSLDEADYQASQINTTLADIKDWDEDTLGVACIHQTEDAIIAASNMFSEIIDILSFAECTHLNRVWTGVVEFTAAACLYVLIVLTAIVYPSYKGRFLRTICWCCFSNSTPVKQDDSGEEGHGEVEASIDQHRSSADYELVSLQNVEEGRNIPEKSETSEFVDGGVHSSLEGPENDTPNARQNIAMVNVCDDNAVAI